MKYFNQVAFFAMSMTLSGLCAHSATVPILSRGETTIGGTSGKLEIKVVIKVHEVSIGKPSDERPAVIDSSCTYSKYPCSVIDHIEITVNGAAIVLPRSSFCDLADLTGGEIRAEKTLSTLTLYGGDASESYIATIRFDSKGVKSRSLSSSTLPNRPLQETVYHQVTEPD